MADFINARRGRNALSAATHVALNLILAAASTALTLISGSWILGVILVLLSKWRVVAVRPRYWWLNIKSSLVDLIVGMSLVLLVYYAGAELNVGHIILTIIYALWLVAIKPRSSEMMTEIQSLFAVFFGTAAATFAVAKFDPLILVIASFVIGYGAIRHVLIQGEDRDFSLVTFVSGLLMAEISWVLYHWMIVYSLDAVNLVVPQLAIVQTLLAFVSFKGYKSVLRHDGKMRVADVVMPILFSVAVMVVMVLFFSKPIFNV
ncbi:MAG: hypothetical protein LBT19_00580 [Candidatus Nomurabacteria bacterium]|jgi:hypothetical protein|nr:hypothetical protein [Candidatus Nomurabacteria bacterium]